jgi:hypothetical protein
MVNGSLKAKPMELWLFGETSAETGPIVPQTVYANAKPLARFSHTGHWKPA